MDKFKFPEFKTIEYTINPETGKYQKQPERIPFNKLPFELKVETTQDERIKLNGATEIITGRIVGGKRLFFTGLLAFNKDNEWYYGNDYEMTKEGKRNSIVIFHFSKDSRHLVIYYFNNYYKFNSVERKQFVSDFIKHSKDH